ncbi:hypothetical protein M885DRAFT_225959 [Pelagophyceae sp. CCMP2097]|nr:hypothetical protein M885DRAFT_225959 [Pelagophyceae sp. CCMP2097]
MRPYINRGHQVLVNYLQIFVLSCLALALILYGELLSDRAAKIFAWIVSAISIFITVRLYSAYKSEEVTEIVELVRSRRAFDRNAFLRLHVGMNVRVMDHAVFAAALAILDDEFLETTAKAPQAAGAAAVPGWAYLTAHLLPLRDVWTRAARKRTVLLTHAPRLLENAALLVRTRVRCAPEAGGVVMSERKFAKAVDSVLGPLAQELCGDVVAETFSRFAAAEPQPTLALDDFEAALRAILDHTSEQEEQDLDASLRCGGRASVPASLRGLALAVLPAKKFAPCKKYDAENQDSEDDSPGGARAAVGAWAAVEERASRMLLRLRPTGRHATRGSPHKETPQARSAADVGPAPGEACRRHNDKFFDLAVHAHAANFKCWMVMEEAAAAILAEPDWGARISALADFSDGPDALLQTPLQDPRLVAWVAGLGGDALREHFDEAVLPHALRSVALDAHPAFIAALRALMCVPEADDDAEDEKEEEARALWTTKVELYKFCSATAVKSATRMSAKVEVYRGEDGPASASWPRAARITDPLRATVVCDDAEAIVRAYDALRGGGADGTGVHLEHGGGADDTAANAHPFRVTRLKNKLGLCTKPFNLHINCVFDRGDGAAPITTEIQIVPRAVNAVTGPSHKFYTLSRALKAEALV